MKVTMKMMDKELRLKGEFIDFIVSAHSEDSFLKHALRNNKILNRFFAGRNINTMECREEWIERQNKGSKIRIRIYKPLHAKGDLPGVLWIHGGGYAMGLPELEEHFYTTLMETSECVIVAPDYRLSVEAPYPAALEDCYEALLWMKNHSKELGIRSNQLMVGGNSAGGGLTAALSLYARDKRQVNLAFQMPLYPMIDDRMITESARDNNAPIWNSDLNKWGWKLYLGELYEKQVPYYAAPARALEYNNLPPTVTFVGDLDPFRDETSEYVNKLRQAGVKVDFEIYKGCFHGFNNVCTRAQVSQMAIAFLKKSFKYAVDNYFEEQKQCFVEKE